MTQPTALSSFVEAAASLSQRIRNNEENISDKLADSARAIETLDLIASGRDTDTMFEIQRFTAIRPNITGTNTLDSDTQHIANHLETVAEAYGVRFEAKDTIAGQVGHLWLVVTETDIGVNTRVFGCEPRVSPKELGADERGRWAKAGLDASGASDEDVIFLDHVEDGMINLHNDYVRRRRAPFGEGGGDIGDLLRALMGAMDDDEEESPARLAVQRLGRLH